MTPALDVRLYRSVAAAVGVSHAERELAVDLCIDAITIALDVDVPHRGRTARCAAQLLLREAVPAIGPADRDAIAHLCEVIVVRGL